MFSRICLLAALLTWMPAFLLSQSADAGLNQETYHLVDRVDIRGLADTLIHTDFKPYSMSYAADVLRLGESKTKNKSEKKWYALQRRLVDDTLAGSNPGKGILKTFYRNGRDLYAFRSGDFEFYLNPILYLTAGGDHQNYTPDANLLNYRNTRGVQIRGTFFKRLGFYTEVTENQAKYPYFIKDYCDSLPALFGEGFYKTFKGYGYDYFGAKGYVTFSPFSKMRIKFGKDRVFFGNGYQSLLLSDNSTDHLFLNIVTRIWKLEYVNHFAQMIDFIPGKPDPYGTHPKKFAVFHQLSLKPWKTFSFSVFESIVYASNNPAGSRSFELEYLNPIIFYRSTEQFLGSPDNAFVGFQFKWNFLKRFQTYGQGIIDDFNWRNRVNGKGYWGNKIGYQLGLKYINAFWVNGLDLQVEYNYVRPYTYQHFNPSANYTHYRQYLAHSMGANLTDLNVIVRYQPFPRWSGMMIFTHLKKGLDIGNANYGGDPFITNLTRLGEYNNFMHQGTLLTVNSLFGKISYQIMRLNGFAELEFRYHKANTFSSVSVAGTLRLNIPYKPVKF